MSGVGGDAVAEAIEGMRGEVMQGIERIGGKIDRLAHSMRAVESGLADEDEFQRRVARVRTPARRRQILAVADYMAANPRRTAFFAAKQVFRRTEGGYPTPRALMNASRRAGVEARVGRPVG